LSILVYERRNLLYIVSILRQITTQRNLKMTLYVVKNSTSSDLTFVDNQGNPQSLAPYASGTFDLSPSVYNKLIGSIGASNQSVVGTANYRYAILGVAPVATPTDFIVMQGSATMVVRIKRIRIEGVATAQGNMPVEVVRRSTAGTLGSAVLTAVTGTPEDIQSPVATATVSSVGTANFGTVGTLVGILESERMSFSAVGTGAAGSGTELEFDYDTEIDASGSMVLRGVADFICINLTGAAIPSGGLVDVTIETVESAS
jgi:hypothetical protein